MYFFQKTITEQEVKTDIVEPTGIIFNIQRYTVHDGPGIRTEFFLKGCTLSCEWCSNPEGLSPRPQVGIYPNRCLGADKCSWCRKVCPVPGALVTVDGKTGHVDRDRCTGCMACTDTCPAEALKRWGTEMTVSEALDIAMADREFYRKSGGGVTVSGGESLLQYEFVAALYAACRQYGIHTCVESALNVPRENVEAVLSSTDLFITDIKHMDSAVHAARCGAGNERIHENIRYIASSGKPMVIRIPVIRGFNADEENIIKTGEFIRNELGGAVRQLQLLPYRQLGTEKYASLEMLYPMEGYDIPDREEWEQVIRNYAELLQKMGVPAVSGSNTPIPL
ncbi:MAG: glycyl-radical enzyme activating protein [Eubacterium sp.]|nr:glycyl-radical enzyme activating protein [Eubacterium sp.]